MTPVTIVAGFLGAGKTTLINHLLAGDHGLKLTVLVNDFGKINIDAELILRREREVMELSNGCICCSIQGDLVGQLQRLFSSATPPEYLLIEASGISQPGRIASIFGYPQLRGLARLDAVVTLLDAANLDELTPSAAALVRHQIEAADLVLMTKCDLVERDKLSGLKEQWLFPDLPVVEALHGRVPPALLLDLKPDVTRRENAKRLDPVHDFRAITWTSSKALSYPRFKAALESLPGCFFRAKGFLYCNEFSGERIAFHKVARRIDFAKTGPWPAPPATRVVAIGELDPDEEAAFFSAMNELLD